MEVHDDEQRGIRSGHAGTMIPLDDLVHPIETRADLTAFIEELGSEVRDRPDGWENAALDRYLAALASWTEDMGVLPEPG